jgi:hypothetical protein
MDGAYRLMHPKRDFSTLEVLLVMMLVAIGMLTAFQYASLEVGILLGSLVFGVLILIRRRRRRLE